MSTPQRVVLGAWLSMIVLATVRHVSDPSSGGGLPRPPAYISSGILFTMFYGGASFAPGLFATLSVGVVLAAIVKPYADAKGAVPNSGPIFQLAKLVDSISGQPVATTGG
jgi:hypothetical protein